MATITETVNAIEGKALPPVDYEFHEYANLFPLVEGEEFAALVADVTEHGVREHVWLYEGKILDGRNRHRAARASGVEYETKTYTGTDPLAFVVSLNLKRRHLSESQRAMVAAKLATLAQGARTDLEHRANLHDVSAAKAGEMLNVSERSVKSAKHVKEHATPELVAAVETGKVAVSAAAQATRFMSDEQQRTAVADGNLAKAVAEHRRAEAKMKEVEQVIATAPKFTPEEQARIKAMMGEPGDGDIYSRIAEIIGLVAEQPDAGDAAERVPASLAHAVSTKQIHKAAQWLLDFCTAWEVKRGALSFVPAFLNQEAA